MGAVLQDYRRTVCLTRVERIRLLARAEEPQLPALAGRVEVLLFELERRTSEVVDLERCELVQNAINLRPRERTHRAGTIRHHVRPELAWDEATKFRCDDN